MSGLPNALTRSGDSRANTFNLLRLVAAAAVLVSHSFALTGRPEPHLGRHTPSSVGVVAFFGISGFLITQSWTRDPRFWPYVGKRALRILPALVVVVVLVAVAVGPVVTSVGASEYYSHPDTWQYVVRNILIVRPVYDLPAVFEQNPGSASVNGSLWTLEHEVRAYGIVLALGLLGLWGRRRIVTGALVILIAVNVLVPQASLALGDETLLGSFSVGALLFVWRHRVPWSVPVAVALVAIWAAAGITGLGRPQQWLLTIAVPYAVVLGAYRLPVALERPLNGNDLSYGLYVWAFPVQQVIVRYWRSVPVWVMIAVSAVVTGLLAFASWKLVESPALRRKALLSGGVRAPRETRARATVS